MRIITVKNLKIREVMALIKNRGVSVTGAVNIPAGCEWSTIVKNAELTITLENRSIVKRELTFR